MFYSSSEVCCNQFFKGRDCKIYKVCQGDSGLTPSFNILDWEDGEIDNTLVSFSGIGRWRVDDSQPGPPSSKTGLSLHSPKGMLPGEQSKMKIKHDVPTSSSVSFDAFLGLGKVSFYVDGNLKWSENRPGRGAQKVEQVVSPGEHTFTWEYEPPQHANMPLSMVWLDNIAFPV